MKTRLVFQAFKKHVVHENNVHYYAIDYVNDFALKVNPSVFGSALPIEIGTTCIENTTKANRVEITKAEFVAEYKKALKLLRDVNIVTR
jgi:hypothetical protein